MPKTLTIAHWKQDLPAGLVVFLVALPLCLGIALASGAPLFSGIIAGVVGGIIVGMFGGSELGVSGPAAGLAVIVLEAISSLGSFEIFLLAVVFAGGLQFLLGLAKAGIVAYYFPSSVIKGMLAAIGIILILKQIPHLFGHDADYEGDESFIQPDGENTFSELFAVFDSFGPGAVIVGLISLALLILWERPFIKKNKILGALPGPLLVVLAGIGLKLALDAFFPALSVSPEHLVQLPMASNWEELGGLITLPDWTAWSNPDVWMVAFTLALVASIESLLSVEATDKLDPQKRITPSNRELKAQGLANAVSGFLGGLPVTQVIVRSSANIDSGGKTRLAAFSHGILMLVCVLIIPGVLNHIPLAALAAILILIGYKLAKIELIKKMYKAGISQFVPFAITVVAIVFSDLLTGIAIGMTVAVFFILRKNFKMPFKKRKMEEGDDSKTVLCLSEDVSFLNKGSVLRALQKVKDGSTIVIDMEKTVTIDPDVAEILEDFKETASNKNINYSIINNEHVRMT